MDHEALIDQLIIELPITRDEAADILSNVNWDLNLAKDAYLSLYGLAPSKPQEPPKDSPKPQLKTKKVIEKEKEKQKEEEFKYVLAETNDKFTEQRNIAQQKQRWLLVYVTPTNLKGENPLQATGYIRDYMNCRFVGFVTSLEEPDGKWVTNAYQIRDHPIYIIIDPVTTEKMDSTKVTNQKDLAAFLRAFLIKNDKYGMPIDLIVQRMEMEDYDETDEDEIEEKVQPNLKPVTDPGKIVTIMVQAPDGKKSKLDIGENELINTLYSQISVLLNLDVNQFSLELPFPPTSISDRSKAVKDYNLKSSLVKVVKL